MEDHLLNVNGNYASQTKFVETPFLKILSDVSLIIEIGYHRGVFTEWLFENKNKDTLLISYDITDNKRIIHNENIKFKVSDCFNSSVIQEITHLINTNGKTLILCDGGSKEKEFKVFSNLLKSGDIIMLHDYAHSNSDYNIITNKIKWPTAAESHYTNIKQTIDTNNLVEFMYDDFKYVLWGSFKKQ